MPKEDYLIKYLEKLSRVIAAMLGLKEAGKQNDALRLADEAFKETLSVNVNDLLNFSDEEFQALILKNSFTIAYLQKLCDLSLIIIDTLYEKGAIENMKNLSRKTLLLHRILNEKDKTFSFEREATIADLQKIIDY
ncbi:MAG: hypothetical protein PHH37_08585 [Paludibacter sp.]|nr:hypothetical protein [Paludibacter sp.]